MANAQCTCGILRLVLREPSKLVVARNVRLYFCPTCGSTVYWKPDALPSMIGVAVGALTDPDFPAPAISIFERSKHPWMHFEGEVEHFPASAIREYSPELTRKV
jgi:hypothetical protein